MPKFEAITFDYFGTLVDVDRGGEAGMDRVLKKIGLQSLNPMETYLAWDRHAVQTYRASRYRKYRDVSQDALRKTFDELEPGLAARADLATLTEILLGGLVEDAPPHPEVPGVLDELAREHRLMPITNIDSDLFARSQLANRFPLVTTAEMAQAYKPSERIFLKGLERLGLDASAVLHTSLAPWADIEGAKPLGFTVAWINRTRETLGPWTPRPDFEFADLTGVLSAVR
jgi:2-haloacid dehalogenase